MSNSYWPAQTTAENQASARYLALNIGLKDSSSNIFVTWLEGIAMFQSEPLQDNVSRILKIRYYF